jgi:hypothetical protein
MIKITLVIACVITMAFPFQVNAGSGNKRYNLPPELSQPQAQYNEKGIALAFPEVPRISVYDAYVNFKAGKALLIQAGGSSFEERRIAGAIEVSEGALSRGQIQLPDLPMDGIDIYTYCY